MTTRDGSLLLELLTPWVQQARWYPAKDDPRAQLRVLASIEMEDPAQEGVVAIVLLTLEHSGTTSVLQVPTAVVAQQSEPIPGQIATLGPDSVLVDGPHHPAFLRAWLAAAQSPAQSSLPLTDLDPNRAKVHTGEQSNTSVRIPAGTASTVQRTAIVKFFRVLAPGANPEIEVARALHDAGWRGVPEPLGWLRGTWDAGSGTVSADLAVAAEFVDGSADGFEYACESARAGRSFAPEAHALGTAIASMHTVLREALPDPAPNQAPDLLADLRERARWAARVAPALAELRNAVDRVYARVSDAPLATPQRIHGDLHLGQALVREGQWFLLDFEGEPLRPLVERVRPDQPLRDLAGTLRSLDYAAAVGEARDSQWVEDARTALIEGYRSEGPTIELPLLRALELDRALYEVVYEQQNRPAWVAIPMRGIQRILEEDAPMNHTAPAVPVAEQVLQAVSDGVHFAPHDVLGPHVADGSVTIRTVRHLATAVSFRTETGDIAATHEWGGVWVATIPADEVPDYRVLATYDSGEVLTDDPYRFLPTVGEMDQHLIAEGRHEELWTVLGARVRRYPSPLGHITGTSFAVWAPNARAVRVVGDFNHWDGRGSAMRSLGASGVWEVFLPDVHAGQRYKYEVCYSDGSWHTKADPMARATEIPPATASVIEESDYTWGDQEWMDARAQTNPHQGAVSIYEVHLGSWRQGLSYLELAEQLVEYVQWMGFTHVEFLPVAEHPFGGSWGYQVTSYYAPTSRFGSPDEFRHLVDALHQADIGVIADWVPAHFPKDSWALARFDGTALYEDPDPMRGEQLDWGTYVFNFGRNEVRNFLVANTLYWLTEFHIDALRVDAVASMLYLDYSREPGQWRPNVRGGRENLEAIQFLQEANATAYRVAPGIMMIAEESTAWAGVTAATDHGGLGFGLKWNMGWMNDTLRYISEEPINRRYHHGELTFSLVYAFSEQFVLPISHDEVVHGKGSLWERMPGDLWSKLAGVRLLLAYQWSHPGKNLLFMGSEFAQNTEWAESRSLDWPLSDSPAHAGVRLAVRALNKLYTASPALWADDFSHGGFEWIEANDGDRNVLAYLRRGGGQHMLVVANFSGSAHEDYRVAVPHGGDWEEILNTDHPDFGGSGVLNTGPLTAQGVPWHGRDASIVLRVPPLGVTFLRPVN